MRQRYVVFSPDGIPISPTTYKGRDIAKDALARWVKGYAIQGYYADSRGNRIGLDELPSQCRIQAVGGKNEEG